MDAGEFEPHAEEIEIDGPMKVEMPLIEIGKSIHHPGVGQRSSLRQAHSGSCKKGIVNMGPGKTGEIEIEAEKAGVEDIGRAGIQGVV